MISQSTRFSIGQQDSPTFPIKALSYSTLPTSPREEIKHELQEKSRVSSGRPTGKHVFIPQKNDTIKHRFRLRYSPCSDAYYRKWDDCVLERGDVHGWEKGVYSFESVERIVDAKKNLVYFERTPGSNTGILTWKMDFGSSGLVIDQVSIKVASHNSDGGEVLVMLSSDETKKTISHMEGLGVVKMKGFENSKNLILSIHLIGETQEAKTRLFEKDILSKGDYPLDLKITLKPPVEMYSKPVILLGLMFSYSQETSVDRRHYRTHSSSSGGGFLHLNIVQAKYITSSKDTAPEAQVKCYLLPDDKHIKSCKTGRAKKSSTPIWDEYFVIDGIAQSQLRYKQLGIRVVNWQLGITRKNTILGEVRIGSTDRFDFHSLPSPRSSHAVQFPKERTKNEAMIYSPLMRVNEERQKKRDHLGSTPDGEDNEVTETGDCAMMDCISLEKDNPGSKTMKKKEDDRHSSDEQLNRPSSLLVENVNRLDCDTENNGNMVSSNRDSINCHASDDQPKNPKEQVILEVNGIKKDSESNSPVRKAKPQRPPPPNPLKLKESLHVRDNATSKEFQEDEDNPRTPVSQRKATTPTLSRLRMKLPLSPRRNRRSSWGGESDMSLQSPRSTQSPSDYESLESRQWDFMISRPKQWIYCWQALELYLDE